LLLNFSDESPFQFGKIRRSNPSINLNSGGQLKLTGIQSTTDHNFLIHSEYQRILQEGGRIQKINGNVGKEKTAHVVNLIGPLRVWLKNEDRPGLAMTRSVGDTLAKTVGVISTPEVTTFDLTHKYSILVIGSDGLFEFLTNQEIADIIQGPQQDNFQYQSYETINQKNKTGTIFMNHNKVCRSSDFIGAESIRQTSR